jgi:hypothetical protein
MNEDLFEIKRNQARCSSVARKRCREKKRKNGREDLEGLQANNLIFCPKLLREKPNREKKRGQVSRNKIRSFADS